MKLCPRCRKNKTPDEFLSAKASNILYCCQKCNKEYHSDYYRENTKKLSKQWENSRLKRKYGITLDEVDRMRERQGGLCANTECGREAKVVDHCHETGKVRGLLCNGCNASLGHLKEDPSRIRGLIRYIKKHE